MDKSKDSRYIFNTKTSKWVLKTGKVGMSILSENNSANTDTDTDKLAKQLDKLNLNETAGAGTNASANDSGAGANANAGTAGHSSTQRIGPFDISNMAVPGDVTIYNNSDGTSVGYEYIKKHLERMVKDGILHTYIMDGQIVYTYNKISMMT